MFKGYNCKTNKDGSETHYVVLGLSELNIKELRRNNPILFFGDDLGLNPDIAFIITYRHADNTFHLPRKEYLEGKNVLVLHINAESCQEMREEVKRIELQNDARLRFNWPRYNWKF